jgi:hypothetical protein
MDVMARERGRRRGAIKDDEGAHRDGLRMTGED